MPEKLNTDGFDLLQQAVESGIIDVASVKVQLEKMNREEILSKHTHKITQGKDGKWRTRVPCEGYEKNLKLICKTTLEALENAIIEAYKEPEEIYTFAKAFREWNDKRLENRKIKASSHRVYLDVFRYSFKDSAVLEMDLSKTTPGMWQDYLESMACNCCQETYKIVKVIIKGTLKQVKRNGHISFSITDIFDTLDVSSNQFRKTEHDESKEVFTEDEVAKLETYFLAEGSIVSLGLLLMFCTGLRGGELCTLHQSDFTEDYCISIAKTDTTMDEDGKHVHVLSDSPKTDAGKRIVPVPDTFHWLVDAIREKFTDDSPFAFSSARTRTGYIGKERFTRKLKKACDDCGIDYKTPHKIRKTYVSTLYDEDVNPKIIAKLAGHKTVEMTLSKYNKDRSSQKDRLESVNKAFGNNSKVS